MKNEEWNGKEQGARSKKNKVWEQCINGSKEQWNVHLICEQVQPSENPGVFVDDIIYKS